jgi:undecaprenyl-diphosphatase
MEEMILLFIQNHIRCALLNPIIIFITHLGDSGLIWILICILLLIFKKTRTIGLMIVVSLLLSLLVNNLCLKNMFMRTRPYEAINQLTRLIEAQSDYSFPSGHSASSFAAAIILYKTLPKKYGILALVLAFLIAISRLYVGVHYPTDVLFGILSGTLIALFTIKIFNKYKIKLPE